MPRAAINWTGFTSLGDYFKPFLPGKPCNQQTKDIYQIMNEYAGSRKHDFTSFTTAAKSPIIK